MELLPELGRVIGAFAFVIGLMYGIAWVMRRFKLDEKLQGRGRSKGSLSIEDSLFIDGKRRVVVLGHHSERYLLLLGPNGDTLLNAAVKREMPGE